MIIAELGHNHNGNMALMKEMIYRASDCGVDIVKFQLYDTSKIVPRDHQWYWDLERGEITHEQWINIVDICGYLNVEFMASVFDVERVEWAKEVGMKRYKIASRSIYDRELLEAVADTGKPIIISLGMTDERGIPKIKGTSVDYLFCVAKYPTQPQDIDWRRVDFTIFSGFSDHTIGIEAPLIAVARGAKIIEKHFTLDKTMDGCDHSGSAEPHEFKELAKYMKGFKKWLQH